MVLRLFARLGNRGPVLPIKSLSPARPILAAFMLKRYTRVVLLAVFSLCAIFSFFFFYGHEFSLVEKSHLLPPKYREYSKNEENLPQHNLDLYPEGRNAKYFWPSNHVACACSFSIVIAFTLILCSL